MHNTQHRFPIHVHTGWADYSPALHYHAAQQIRSRLAAFGSEIQSVTVRLWSDQPGELAHRRCEIDVMTHAESFAVASVGVDLATLVDGAVDRAVTLLRQRTHPERPAETRRRIA
jgi:hypothetical protein